MHAGLELTILTPFEYWKEHIVLMDAFPMTPSANSWSLKQQQQHSKLTTSKQVTQNESMTSQARRTWWVGRCRSCGRGWCGHVDSAGSQPWSFRRLTSPWSGQSRSKSRLPRERCRRWVSDTTATNSECYVTTLSFIDYGKGYNLNMAEIFSWKKKMKFRYLLNRKF